MILGAFRILLFGGIAFGAVAALLAHLPATERQAGAAPPDARPAARQAPPARIAASVDTPLGDASFRAWCTWTLRERLSDRPDWTVGRAAAFCLCIADRAREGRPAELPEIPLGTFLATVEGLERRLCRPS